MCCIQTKDEKQVQTFLEKHAMSRQCCSERGLHKVTDSRLSENVDEPQILFGLTNSYNKFIKHLATIFYPLNQLLQKGNPCNRALKYEGNFNSVNSRPFCDFITLLRTLSNFRKCSVQNGNGLCILLYRDFLCVQCSDFSLVPTRDIKA